jgi:hypothetical protein
MIDVKNKYNTVIKTEWIVPRKSNWRKWIVFLFQFFVFGALGWGLMAAILSIWGTTL